MYSVLSDHRTAAAPDAPNAPCHKGPRSASTAHREDGGGACEVDPVTRIAMESVRDRRSRGGHRAQGVGARGGCPQAALMIILWRRGPSPWGHDETDGVRGDGVLHGGGVARRAGGASERGRALG